MNKRKAGFQSSRAAVQRCLAFPSCALNRSPFVSPCSRDLPHRTRGLTATVENYNAELRSVSQLSKYENDRVQLITPALRRLIGSRLMKEDSRGCRSTQTETGTRHRVAEPKIQIPILHENWKLVRAATQKGSLGTWIARWCCRPYCLSQARQISRE